MKATIEQIRTITPAAIAKIPIHFQIPPSSPSSGVVHEPHVFQGQLSISNTACDLSLQALRFSVFNPQQLLPSGGP